MLRKLVARALRKAARIIDPELPTPAWRGTDFHCPVCGEGLAHFCDLPRHYLKEHQDNQCIHSPWFAENPNLLQYSCPACAATDRERLYALHFSQSWRETSSETKIRFLDIAPSTSFSRWIRSHPFIDYRSADLMMSNVDDRVDLTNMSVYADDTWDCFLCSHVLEHIPEDRKAMSELRRVLKPGGWGIVMVPINLGLNDDYENSQAITVNDRWKHFGQDDHVRMYSKQGFVRKLQDSGFRVEQLGESHFSTPTLLRCGIHPRTVLYVAHKDRHELANPALPAQLGTELRSRVAPR